MTLVLLTWPGGTRSSTKLQAVVLATQSGGTPARIKTSLARPVRSKSSLRKWARTVIAAAEGLEPIEVVREVARAADAELARAELAHTELEGDQGNGSSVLRDVETPAEGWADPWLLGLVHEYAVSETNRKSRGAWYTPEAVVRGLVALAVPDGSVPELIVDPTCGGGAFLLAALDRLVALGLDAAEAVRRVKGTDIDKDAVTVSRLAIQIWAKKYSLDLEADDISVETSDALDGFPAHWVKPMTVVGNPPFASPLRKGAIPDNAEKFRSCRSDLLQSYADLAAIHLLSAIEQAGDGSTVALVQPQSILASRDTEALRTMLSQQSAMQALWVSREAVFDAGVRVCAPLVRVGSPPPNRISLWTGPNVDSAGFTRPVSWASCAARALGAPKLPVQCWSPSLNLGSLATATAGFRDEYYGLVEACFELPEAAVDHGARSPDRLLTVGSVEPLASLWGIKPTRLGGHDWQRPVVDRSKLEPKVLRWVERQAQPKVVLATQSKVLEPVIDPDGSFVPVTPLIAVHAVEDDLALVAAVLLAPPVVAWAWERWFGSAMAVDALKLAAKQVLELPLPSDRGKWEQAAALIVSSTVPVLTSADSTVAPRSLAAEQGKQVAIEVGSLMTNAYGADRHVFEWWEKRIT